MATFTARAERVAVTGWSALSVRARLAGRTTSPQDPCRVGERMPHAVVPSLIVLVAMSAFSVQAQNPPQRIAACSLLPRAEVRKHLPWNDIVDRMPAEEEPVGAAGSSCNYPAVFIQAFPVGRLVRGQPTTEPGWQPISGVGDDAWFRANRSNYAELYVKTATHTLTIQANANGNVEAVKPGAIELAGALLGKLR